MCSQLKNRCVAPVFYKFHSVTLTLSESIHQELTDIERRAKDAMLLQVRRCLCLCNTRNMLVGGVLVSAEQYFPLAQHEEHLGGGGFSVEDEVRQPSCGVWM